MGLHRLHPHVTMCGCRIGNDKKVSSKATHASVKNEMAQPRIAKLARIAEPDLKKGAPVEVKSLRTPQDPTTVAAQLETPMSRELKKKRDEAKQAWENATVVLKKVKKADDFTGSKKAHDEAEKLRVEYLMAKKASGTDSDDSENTLAISAHGCD
jgi:hypothetical protein